ncbi:hypothetical protein HPP92_006299 [Vanilla planifolia]|uniref:Protein SDA1 n=1 Tax=Vanilla planifolia TaxID=51239 RepID=A0A835RMZ7_VANPL|nr:hypothetical protein HPP92_006299 [Vanilla planifolia]
MPQSSPYSENELDKKQTSLAQFLKFEKEDHQPVEKQEHERSHGIKTYGSSKQDISDRDVSSVKAMLWGENEQQESEKDTGGADHPEDDADTTGLHPCVQRTSISLVSFEVPPDVVERLLRQIVNQFVQDRSCPEAIVVGLNVVREMCLRMPLMVLACKWLPLKATALYAFLPASNLVQVEKSCW